jgi:GNAT superfamily N-acetyltransferase
MDLIRADCLDNSMLFILAAHLVSEFGHLYPQWDPGTALQELREDSGSGVPIHVVAIENGEPVGVASIIPDDEVVGWEDKNAWLANVLVLPEYRGRGIGKLLIDRAAEFASESGQSDLHLVTDMAEEWYSRQGWEHVGIGNVHGNLLTVMRFSLHKAQFE